MCTSPVLAPVDFLSQSPGHPPDCRRNKRDLENLITIVFRGLDFSFGGPMVALAGDHAACCKHKVAEGLTKYIHLYKPAFTVLARFITAGSHELAACALQIVSSAERMTAI